MKMQAPARRTLTEEVLEQLRARVIAGEIKPGGRMPTLDALVEQLQVSRTVVREAVARLVSEGWVVVRHGSGVYVTVPPPAAFQITAEEMDRARDVLWVLELRLAVEAEMAALAARRRTDADVQTLRSLLDSMQHAHALGADTARADAQLHDAIARATHNPYFLRFTEFLGERLVPPRSLPLGSEDPEDARRYLDQVHGEHELIVSAIAQMDVALAREAARRHLENSLDRLTRRLALAAQAAGAEPPTPEAS
jgi:GntR family transcriptional regulator, transcriptional repressor for pyruvate dehydrogenase complex